MVAHISQRYLNPARGVAHSIVLATAHVDIGATGASTLSSSLSDPGITITRAGVGDYDLTFDTGNIVRIPEVKFYSPAGTIDYIRITAFSGTAGTMSIQCYSDLGTTAADPASGDDLEFNFWYSAGAA